MRDGRNIPQYQKGRHVTDAIVNRKNKQTKKPANLRILSMLRQNSVTESSPIVHSVLGSNPSTIQEKRKKKDVPL